MPVTKYWVAHVAVLCALAVSLFAPSPHLSRAALIDLPYRIEPAMTSSVGAAQSRLVSDGSLIVWQDGRAGSPDIFAYDLEDGREFQVSRLPAFRSQPSISGSRVIWLTGAEPASRTIQGIDLSQDVSFDVTTEPAEVSDPAISGDIVVWRQRAGAGWDIRVKNLRSGETWNATDDDQNQAYPTISGQSIVWQEYRDGQWDIVRYDVVSRAASPLTSSADDESNPALDGDDLVYLRQPQLGGPPQLIARSLSSGAEKTIVADHRVMRPAVGNGVVAWEDWRTGLPDIYAYDLQHGEMYAIARSQQAYNPAVSQRGIAWISRSDLTRGRVQAVAFVQRLPTDPRESPAVPSPDHVYVPETKHFMSAGFKSFWQSHGGPQLFGYPLSEEFTEKDPATGQDVVVQYFERAVLEYRPSAPEDQRLSLARIGASLTADRQFERIAAFENSDSRVYFPETGHSLAYGFKEFWERNGGLAIFGFPLSEELVENGRTVQYFERARFEFNPNSEDSRYKVILGLLGQEGLQRKGWLAAPPIDTTMLTE